MYYMTANDALGPSVPDINNASTAGDSVAIGKAFL
jgi:hypothetical protein